MVVTRNGKPAAVLISVDDLESLEETLAVMSDRSVAAQLRDSQKAVAAGKPGVSLEELRASASDIVSSMTRIVVRTERSASGCATVGMGYVQLPRIDQSGSVR